jgi:hypothetical protein
MVNFNKSANPLLDALHSLQELTENSKMEKSFLDKCRPDIQTIRDFFECSDQQAILLGLLLQQYLSNLAPSVSRLIEHLDLKPSAALLINRSLKDFVVKEWITPKQNLKYYPNSEYILNKKFIHAVTTMDWTNMEPKPINTSFELLEEYADRLNDRRSRRISYDSFVEKTYEFLHQNEQVELSHFILSTDMNAEEAIFYLNLCLQHYLGNHSLDIEKLLSDLFPPMEDKYLFTTAVNNDKSIFSELGLLKVSHDKEFGLFPTEYFLTDTAIKTFHKDAPTRNRFSAKTLNLIDPATINSHDLYYEPEEEQMICRLHQLLEPANFHNLTERLLSKGMNPGFTVLFYGQPGTGKTETVMQLARQSKRHILLADAGNIRSKWVGEAEKNIRKLFKEYKKAVENFEETPILLFNEADAILGTRRTASGLSEQLENSLQNIILEELENFEGIFIATTNMEMNLDKAFDRRFLYKIKFGKPDTDTLMKIWNNKFPEMDKDLVKPICREFSLTGGQIENIRKKVIVDLLLSPEVEITEQYMKILAEQELSLQKNNNNNRNSIGFIRSS